VFEYIKETYSDVWKDLLEKHPIALTQYESKPEVDDDLDGRPECVHQ
jgi:hypothetical protein